MFGFRKIKKESLRHFESYDLDEVMAMVSLGQARPSWDTEEILAGFEAGRFTRAMTIAMFRKPFPLFLHL